MNHPAVFELSRKHGPPRIDLRKAEIMDSYGFEGRATRAINHRTPNDVSRDDLDFYGWIYAFLGFEDLLFYLYPIALELDKSKSLDCIDSFMYSLNRFVPAESSKLSSVDQQALIEGLRWMWDAVPLGYTDWVQCPNLQKTIGVSVSWDDLP